MKTIVCIPGLGGHVSVFNNYAQYLKEYSFEYINLINLKKGKSEILEVIKNKKEEIIVLANCYGALPLIEDFNNLENQIQKLIIIEPFFAELYWWDWPGNILVSILLYLSRLTDKLGFKRSKFMKDIDYTYLSRYPIWLQPFFDLSYQTTTDYLEKIYDISNFKLPKDINIPTLLIFSSGGYSQNTEKRNKIISHFKNSTVVEISKKTHNIVTVSEKEIASIIKNWLTL